MHAYKVLKNELYEYYTKETSFQAVRKYPLVTPTILSLLKLLYSPSYQLNKTIGKHFLDFNKEVVVSEAFFETNKEKIAKLFNNKQYSQLFPYSILAYRFLTNVPQNEIYKDNFFYTDLDFSLYKDDSKKTLKYSHEDLMNNNINYSPLIYQQVFHNSLLKKHNIIINIDLGNENETLIDPSNDIYSVAQLLSLPFFENEFVYFKTSSPSNFVKSMLPSATILKAADIPQELFNYDEQICSITEYKINLEKKKLLQEINKLAISNSNFNELKKTSNADIINPSETNAPEYLSDEQLLHNFEYYLGEKSSPLEDKFLQVTLDKANKDIIFYEKLMELFSKIINKFINLPLNDLDNFEHTITSFFKIQNLFFIIFAIKNKNDKVKSDITFKHITPEQSFLLATHIKANDKSNTKFLEINGHNSVKSRSLEKLPFFSSNLNADSFEKKLSENIFLERFFQSINTFLDNVESFNISSYSDLSFKNSLLWVSLPYLKSKTTSNKKFYSSLNFNTLNYLPFIKTFLYLPQTLLESDIKDNIFSHFSTSHIDISTSNAKTQNFVLSLLETSFKDNYLEWKNTGKINKTIPIFTNLEDFFAYNEFSEHIYGFLKEYPEYKTFLFEAFIDKCELNTAYYSKLLHNFLVLNACIYQETMQEKLNSNPNNSFSTPTVNINYYKGIPEDHFYFLLKCLSANEKEHIPAYHNIEKFQCYGSTQHVFDYLNSNQLEFSEKSKDVISYCFNEDIKRIEKFYKTSSSFTQTTENNIKSIFSLRIDTYNSTLKQVFEIDTISNSFYNLFENSKLTFGMNTSSNFLKEHFGKKIIFINPKSLELSDIENFDSFFYETLFGNQNTMNLSNYDKKIEILNHLTLLNPDFYLNVKNFDVIFDKFLTFENSNEISLNLLVRIMNYFPQNFIMSEKNELKLIQGYNKINEQDPNGLHIKFFSHVNNNLQNILMERQSLDSDDSQEAFFMQRDLSLRSIEPPTSLKIKKF